MYAKHQIKTERTKWVELNPWGFQKEKDNTFIASATNQIGPMNATFSGTVKISNIKVNESYTLSGEGHSSVGFVNGEASVKLIEENNSTNFVAQP